MKELNGIQYIERKPVVETENPQLFLLIHGYGSNEQDLFSFTPDLPETAHVVSVRARYDIQFGGFAWYDISFENNEKYMDIDQAIESRECLVSFIDAIVAQENLDAKNVFIAGFSQGAILSYSIALNYPEKVKNVMILSGYPEYKIIGDFDQSKDFSHLNFFVSHGTEDVILPIEAGRLGEGLLNQLNIKNEYHEYRSGHGIDRQNYFDLMDFIKKAL
ncbi:alpha/beta hydrolase [Faecalibacter macacae]|uniref:Phospholipase n=1 Tax=Faecalibacter macacae TaxID=1859289 RepID=A0A3L9MJ74_9FLAO|nr:PHB depolymerase family esterase [Faecalibacter macacae]RLZ12822.1 phospholipase [Faecalibacter macacae]